MFHYSVERRRPAFWRGWAGNTSAEIFAKVALRPFETIEVRVQAHPYFANGLADGVPKLYASEGIFRPTIGGITTGVVDKAA
ncbi:hypothetical protein ACOSP7_022453 [Xanthoceras sorbifolium]